MVDLMHCIFCWWRILYHLLGNLETITCIFSETNHAFPDEQHLQAASQTYLGEHPRTSAKLLALVLEMFAITCFWRSKLVVTHAHFMFIPLQPVLGIINLHRHVKHLYKTRLGRKPACLLSIYIQPLWCYKFKVSYCGLLIVCLYPHAFCCYWQRSNSKIF